MEQKLVQRLVQVGIRTFTAHQREQVRKFGVESIEMHQLTDRLQLQFDSPVYISFDIDALDPAFAPGVSHREPGGMSTRQAIDLIQRLKGKSRRRRYRGVQPAHGPAAHHGHCLCEVDERDCGEDVGVRSVFVLLGLLDFVVCAVARVLRFTLIQTEILKCLAHTSS
jgi:hypothetical protein